MTRAELEHLYEQARDACAAAQDEVERLDREAGDARRRADRLTKYRDALAAAAQNWCQLGDAATFTMPIVFGTSRVGGSVEIHGAKPTSIKPPGSDQ